jgi:hypothetical protein
MKCGSAAGQPRGPPFPFLFAHVRLASPRRSPRRVTPLRRRGVHPIPQSTAPVGAHGRSRPRRAQGGSGPRPQRGTEQARHGWAEGCGATRQRCVHAPLSSSCGRCGWAPKLKNNGNSKKQARKQGSQDRASKQTRDDSGRRTSQKTSALRRINVELLCFEARNE